VNFGLGDTHVFCDDSFNVESNIGIFGKSHLGPVFPEIDLDGNAILVGYCEAEIFHGDVMMLPMIGNAQAGHLVDNPLDLIELTIITKFGPWCGNGN
jgi:hypothetical protein